eukprot:TRINITY_DN12434_c0_g1_i1.p1 TRINITY_DN12434_c0_g1~~TRINITY_DN12434_c0_g1_i1.p1  ORF type:complete len:210 (+),score=39.74 TRINITY_DN12434_c0_g1_i1:235-864(+)
MRNWRRHRSETGPHLLEKCCHDIDYLNFILDDLPTKVASFAGLDIFTPKNKPEQSSVRGLYYTWPAWEDVDPFDSDKDTEDNQVVIMQYRSGTRGTFHTNCNSAFPERSIRMFGVKGTLMCDLLTGEIKYKLIEANAIETVESFGKRGMHGGADEIIVSDLALAMREKKKPRAGGDEGFKSALICLAIDQSHREGTVVDLEDIWKKFQV